MALSIDDLLRRAVETKASDLHLKVGNHPYLRIDGQLNPQTDVTRVTPYLIAISRVIGLPPRITFAVSLSAVMSFV